MVSIKDVLLKLAAEAPVGFMDDVIHLDSNLCLFLMADNSKSQLVFIDVPVDRVVALGRRDFIKPDDTWRSAVQSLTCNSWTDAVFDYFDAPLQEKSFPAPSSLYEMHLNCIGGLCQVANGNHRLVAGRAWLTAIYGNSAFWKTAKVRYHPLTIPGREILTRAAKANSGVLVANFDSPHVELIVEGRRIKRLAALSIEPLKVFLMGEHKLVVRKTPWHCRIHGSHAWTELRKVSWSEIPAAMVKRLLDDNWITSQV